MQWFKHYSNTDKSNFLTNLFAEQGFQGLGRYWRLLELLAKKFEGEETEFVFATRELKSQLGFHRDVDLVKFLSSLDQTPVKSESSLDQMGIMSHRQFNQMTIISTSILLELQSRDFKRARNGRVCNPPKNKDKRIKNKDNTTPSVDVSELPEIAKIWNEVSDKRLPKVLSMSKKSQRYKACIERWKENPNAEHWRNAIKVLNSLNWALGENDRGWKANLEFLVRPDAANKILEGQYGSKKQESPFETF